MKEELEKQIMDLIKNYENQTGDKVLEVCYHPTKNDPVYFIRTNYEINKPNKLKEYFKNKLKLFK